MSRIVQKFGGTSVADMDLIRHAAGLVAAEMKNNNEVAVVVSAMAGVTNQLVSYVNNISTKTQSAEHDVVYAAGEQVTSGLLALAIQELGIPSRSFLAWQLPIITDEAFTQSTVTNINTAPLDDCFKQGIVPVIAGFQGVTENNRLTTLGRGGSDTTAVALAAALKADQCDIYTDVLGVYTADPRIVPNARKLDHIHYDEMYELAKQGAKVLHSDCVEIAMKYGLSVRVLSTFAGGKGTSLSGFKNYATNICGIALTLQDVHFTLTHMPLNKDSVAKVYAKLLEARIAVDMIIQNLEAGDLTNMSFTVPKSHAPQTIQILQSLHDDLDFKNLQVNDNMAKISIVGSGFDSYTSASSILETALFQKGIQPIGMTKSATKMSVLVDRNFAESAVKALHHAFKLDMEFDR